MALYSSKLMPTVSVKATLGGCGVPGYTVVMFLASFGNRSFVLFTGEINVPSGRESDVKSYGQVRA